MSDLHQLYRYYDKDDVLLYVGMTENFEQRDAIHRTNSHWYSQVGRHSQENYPDKVSLRDAERLAIYHEKPLHNSCRLHKGYEEVKESAVAKKQRLVSRAVDYMGSQLALVEAMNAINRPDGRTTRPTDVSRWVNEDRMVNPLDAIWIHQATGGAVDVLEFYPYLRDELRACRTKRAKAAA